MPLQTPTILVVEDERPLEEAISTKLRKSGFEVVSARTVAQAQDYLNELKRVDALWLDHYLIGEETGLDLVVKMKAPDSKWRSTPIFVVSNTAGPDKVKRYLELGVNRYFVKAEKRLDDIIAEIKKSLPQSQS